MLGRPGGAGDGGYALWARLPEQASQHANAVALVSRDLKHSFACFAARSGVLALVVAHFQYNSGNREVNQAVLLRSLTSSACAWVFAAALTALTTLNTA